MQRLYRVFVYRNSMEIMARTNEVYAYFQLSGVNLEPDEITAQLGIEPTKCWRTGDLVVYPNGKVTNKTRTFSLWEVRSQLDSLAEVDPKQEFDLHLESVFRQLERGWALLGEMGLKYKALVGGVVSVYPYTPAVSLQKEHIQKIGELNAGVDIYVY